MRIQLSIAQRANRLFLMNCRHSESVTDTQFCGKKEFQLSGTTVNLAVKIKCLFNNSIHIMNKYNKKNDTYCMFM